MFEENRLKLGSQLHIEIEKVNHEGDGKQRKYGKQKSQQEF